MLNSKTNAEYTFQIQIDRDDRTVVESTFTAVGADEIAEVKENIRCLLDAYTPAAQKQDGTPVLPQETKAPMREEPPSTHAIPTFEEGAIGALHLHCTACDNTFGTFLRERQRKIACKCGHEIDLTAPLARYRYTCPYCEKERYGKTNAETPEITVRCVCQENVLLRWNLAAREYQN